MQRRITLILMILTVLALIVGVETAFTANRGHAAAQPAATVTAVPEGAYKPRYAADGALIRPTEYREWVYLSSGLGMNYGPAANGGNQPPAFTNVFVNPEAYREF